MPERKRTGGNSRYKALPIKGELPSHPLSKVGCSHVYTKMNINNVEMNLEYYPEE